MSRVRSTRRTISHHRGSKVAKAYPSTAHHVAHQFEDVEQQHESSTLGMWVFLATEVMFFGAAFAAYMVYRTQYPAAWAFGSHHLNELFGTINTAVLLTSSLTVALAVHAAQEGKTDRIARLLLITVALAFVFLVIKGIEYYGEYKDGLIPLLNFTNPELADPGQAADPGKIQLFMIFYFTMTGLHALHILIGIGLLSTIAFFARRGRYSAAYATPVELSGLYWHFVDLVWVFLFPLLYLTGPRV